MPPRRGDVGTWRRGVALNWDGGAAPPRPLLGLGEYAKASRHERLPRSGDIPLRYAATRPPLPYSHCPHKFPAEKPVSLESLPVHDGIAPPLNSLLWSASSVKLERLPSCDGMFPLNSLHRPLHARGPCITCGHAHQGATSFPRRRESSRRKAPPPSYPKRCVTWDNPMLYSSRKTSAKAQR